MGGWIQVYTVVSRMSPNGFDRICHIFTSFGKEVVKLLCHFVLLTDDFPINNNFITLSGWLNLPTRDGTSLGSCNPTTVQTTTTTWAN